MFILNNFRSYSIYKNILGCVTVPFKKIFVVIFKDNIFEVFLQVKISEIVSMLNYLRSSSKLNYLSWYLSCNIWGHLPSKRIFEVVFHLQKCLRSSSSVNIKFGFNQLPICQLFWLGGWLACWLADLKLFRVGLGSANYTLKWK